MVVGGRVVLTFLRHARDIEPGAKPFPPPPPNQEAGSDPTQKNTKILLLDVYTMYSTTSKVSTRSNHCLALGTCIHVLLSHVMGCSEHILHLVNLGYSTSG